MYTPKANEETNIAVLHNFMRENPLCVLVTHSERGLLASHLPLVLEDDGSSYGVLKGHFARANPQWKEAAPLEDALAIFSGPHHYISASWYPGTMADGKEVPTWNYVAVYAYGRLRIIEDLAWLLDHLRALAERSEVIVELPWKLSDAPPEFIAKLTGGIVGFEIPITRLEGKWKVSQNRDEQDATAVMQGLESLGTPEATAMQELIASQRPR